MRKRKKEGGARLDPLREKTRALTKLPKSLQGRGEREGKEAQPA